jgi:[ribosomal protein S5]-alanine N-acetyltransferase
MHVRIRPPEPGDEEELVALNRASVHLHRCWITPPATAAEFADYLRRCRRTDYSGRLIVRASDGAVVGAANLSHITPQTASVGFYLGKPYLGHGYMTEALALIAVQARDSLRLRRLEAEIQPANERAAATVQRAGFQPVPEALRILKIDDRWCDHACWVLGLA